MGFYPKCGTYMRNSSIVLESCRGHNRSVKCPSNIWFLHLRIGQDEKITTYLTLTLLPFRQPMQLPYSMGSIRSLLLWNLHNRFNFGGVISYKKLKFWTLPDHKLLSVKLLWCIYKVLFSPCSFKMSNTIKNITQNNK